MLPDGIERYGVSGNILFFFFFAYYDKKKKEKKLNKRPIWGKGNLSDCQSLVRERPPGAAWRLSGWCSAKSPDGAPAHYATMLNQVRRINLQFNSSIRLTAVLFRAGLLAGFCE
jgi:hypothetical protein